MIRERSDDQVRTSAAQMDAALAAGLTAEQLATLTAARATWHATATLPQATPLLTALAHPAALEWDRVFVTATRRLTSGRRTTAVIGEEE